MHTEYQISFTDVKKAKKNLQYKRWGQTASQALALVSVCGTIEISEVQVSDPDDKK